MKHPALPPALLFALGIAVSGEGWLPIQFWLGATLLGLLLSAVHRLQAVGLAAAIIALGSAYREQRLESDSPVDLRQAAGADPKIVTLIGTLEDTPALRLAEVRGELTGRTLVPLRVSGIQASAGVEILTGLVMTTMPGVLPSEFFRSQRVKVTGVLSRPPGPEADQLFDYRAFLANQGIWFTLRTEGPQDWQLAAQRLTTPPWGERFLPWAHSVLTRGLPDDEATRLLVAMALGWKTPLSGEINDIFMRSGTLHVFAISGLHIGLIAWILVEVLRLLRISRQWCGWVAIPLVWFYVAATGWQASAIRSAIMSSVVVAGWALNRPGNLLNSLAVSAWMILVWDPGQLFQASFQLSFAAVAGLAIVGPSVQQFLVRWIRLPWDPFIPDDLEPKWRRWTNSLLRLFAQALAVGMASLVASLPLTIHWFHLVSPVSLLANLVVVPLSSLALVANFASILSAIVCPWLTTLFNASAWVLMQGMLAVSEWSAALPGGHRWVESPPWLVWIAYYLTVCVAVRGLFFRPKYAWPLRILLACGAGLAGFFWGLHRAEYRLAVLGGDALVQLGPGGALVFNGGNERTVERLTIPYLHAHGVNRLNGLCATGESVQQIGGIPRLLELFRPRQFWLGEHDLKGAAVRKALSAAESQHLEPSLAGRNITLSGWLGLHPASEDRFSRGEDRSLVQSIQLHGKTIVWAGNLGRLGQRQWFERGVPSADIVITGVPPNSEPMGSALLGALSPRYLIVASDRYPINRRIRKSTRDRLVQSGVPTVFTEDSGSVLIRFPAWGTPIFSGDGWERSFSQATPSTVDFFR